MVSIFSFSKKGKVTFEKMYYGEGYNVYYNNILAIKLFRTGTGSYIATKDINIDKHRGLGQYYVIHKKVCTAKQVIDEIEKKFSNFLEAYAVRFYSIKKFLGVVIYSYNYYWNNRKLNEDGYELQYCIELPEDIDEWIEKSKNFENKVFRIVYSDDGKRYDEWVTY